MAYSDFDDYQKKCLKTAVYPDIGKNFVYPTLGLTGEAGEVAEKIKKVIRDDSGIITNGKKEEIKKEMGDVMWYLAQLATELDLNLSDIAKNNISKLKSRKQRSVLRGSGDNR